MRKSLLVVLIIIFVAPILGGCAPYWTGYGNYGYGNYYDPDCYDPGYSGYEGYYGPYYAYPAYGGSLPSILWDWGIRGIRRIKPSILWDRGIQGSPLNRSAGSGNTTLPKFIFNI